MEASLDEVLALLQKCRNENSPVTVLTNTDDSANVVGGFISEVSSVGLFVTCNDAGTGRKMAHVMIDFQLVKTFEFLDPREAPADARELSEAFDYVIAMELQSTTRCVVYVKKN